MIDDPETPALTDIDALMDKDPLSLTSTDIDDIIKYHRIQRQRRASGAKPIKDTAGPKVDLTSIMASILPAKAEVKRRI